jgi:hypothetical protein
MGIVVEADGVLRDQHQRVLADAPGGRLAMGMQQRLQIHLRVVEEPNRRLCSNWSSRSAPH